MNKKKIARLWQRYQSGHQKGKDAYFDADEIDELLDSFEESENYIHYDEVLALGLRLHPDNTALLIRQCKSLVYNEDYADALALIDSLGEKDNDELDMLRVECYIMQDAYDKALEYIEQLMKENCSYLESLFEYIAPILNDTEMPQDAYDFIQRGLMLFPNNLILKDEACYNLETMGDIDGAIRICNELVDKKPYSYDFWFTLGRLYSIKEEYEKAIEAFDFALTCNNSESDDELILLKAFCLFMNESYEKAIEVYRELLAMDEIHDRIIPLLAECYVKMGNYETAYELLKQLLDKNQLPQDSSVYLSYIRCCAEIGHDKEAFECLKKAFRLFPRNVRILSLQTLFQIVNGNLEKEQDETGEELKKMPLLEDLSLHKTIGKTISTKELAKEFFQNESNKN